MTTLSTADARSVRHPIGIDSGPARQATHAGGQLRARLPIDQRTLPAVRSGPRHRPSTCVNTPTFTRQPPRQAGSAARPTTRSTTGRLRQEKCSAPTRRASADARLLSTASWGGRCCAQLANGPGSAGTSTECCCSAARGTTSSARSWVEASTTYAAAPSWWARSQLKAVTHQRSPGTSPGKPYCGAEC